MVRLWKHFWGISEAIIIIGIELRKEHIKLFVLLQMLRGVVKMGMNLRTLMFDLCFSPRTKTVKHLIPQF